MTVVDPIVMSKLYRDHSGDLFAYLARRVGRQRAEDLLADTFRSAIESYATFESGPGKERGWLFGIATNLVRRHWRDEHQRLRTLRRPDLASRMGIDPLVGTDDGTANRIDAQRHASLLLAAVCDLDPEDRDLLILSGWEHMNSRQIGEVLQIQPGAVRTRLHRIRQQLRSTIDTNSQPNPTTSGASS